MNPVSPPMPEMATITYRNVGAKVVHAIWFTTMSVAAVVAMMVMIQRNLTATTVAVIVLSSAIWIQIDYGLQRTIYKLAWFPPPQGGNHAVISHMMLVPFVFGVWMAITKATGGCFERCRDWRLF